MSQSTVTGVFTIHQIALPTPFAVGDVNAYLIGRDGDYVLIDCGPKTEAAQAALLSGLAEHGLKPQDMTALVLTHGHVDHVGLAGFVRGQGVPVWSHPDVADWLEPAGSADQFRWAFFGHLYQKMGVPQEVIQAALKEYSLYTKLNDRSVVDRSLADGEPFPLWPDIRVLYVPGHAQAAIALYHEGDEWLVSGDQVLPHMSPNALIEPASREGDPAATAYTPSLRDLRASFARLRDLAVSQVFPGHGGPFQGYHAWFERREADQHRRRAKFRNLLQQDEPASTWELAERYFPRHRYQASLILSETLGFLDWMQSEGEVMQTMQDGVVRWQTLTQA